MSKKDHKKPIAFATPAAAKEPRASQDPDSYYGKRPAWRFGKMEFRDPYGWHKMDRDTLSEVRQRLVNLESMTWREILVDSQKQNHLVPVNQLCPDAQREAKQRVPDVDELLTLHVNGRKRVWGILAEGVLQIVWWDPYHLICPSPKSHT